MYCPNCQHNLPDGAQTCDTCGGPTTVYGPPEGFKWNKESRLFYRDETIAPGAQERWITWFNPNVGEYQQISYPNAPAPEAPHRPAANSAPPPNSPYRPAVDYTPPSPPPKKRMGVIISIVSAVVVLAGLGVTAWQLDWFGGDSEAAAPTATTAIATDTPGPAPTATSAISGGSSHGMLDTQGNNPAPTAPTISGDYSSPIIANDSWPMLYAQSLDDMQMTYCTVTFDEVQRTCVRYTKNGVDIAVIAVAFQDMIGRSEPVMALMGYPIENASSVLIGDTSLVIFGIQNGIVTLERTALQSEVSSDDPLATGTIIGHVVVYADGSGAESEKQVSQRITELGNWLSAAAVVASQDTSTTPQPATATQQPTTATATPKPTSTQAGTTDKVRMGTYGNEDVYGVGLEWYITFHSNHTFEFTYGHEEGEEYFTGDWHSENNGNRVVLNITGGGSFTTSLKVDGAKYVIFEDDDFDDMSLYFIG